MIYNLPCHVLIYLKTQKILNLPSWYFTRQTKNQQLRYIFIKLFKDAPYEKNTRLSLEKGNFLRNQTEKKSKELQEKKTITLWPLSMYFMATSSLVSLCLKSLATPKFPAPKSFTNSYFSIFFVTHYAICLLAFAQQTLCCSLQYARVDYYMQTLFPLYL